MNRLVDVAVAAEDSVDVDVAAWQVEFNVLFARVAGRFAQVQSRRRARGYLLGLLSQAERKNGWTIAEFAGDATPDGMQRLLSGYVWDADRVLEDLRGYVVDSFGDPRAVLVADETGFVRKGSRSAGVQRQYTGTAGRIENSQVGVFLTYVTPDGTARTFVGRELYLPERTWCQQPQRLAEARVPEKVTFATKPQLAWKMIESCLAAGVPFSWFTADEVYGQNPTLRDRLEQRRIRYVMAIPCDSGWVTGDGNNQRADRPAGALPATAWHRLSAGNGAKGPRLYDWAEIPLQGPHHRLLARRFIVAGGQTPELAYYICFTPNGAGLAELVRVAGCRWAVEECFEAGKNEVGLDHYQVRLYHAWYRHITLAMLAHAFLAVLAARARPPDPPPQPAPGSKAPSGTGKGGTHRLWTTTRQRR